MKNCKVIAGPIAISATESAQTGETIQLEDGDAEFLARSGYVEIEGNPDSEPAPAPAPAPAPPKVEEPKPEPAPAKAEEPKTEPPAKGK